MRGAEILSGLVAEGAFEGFGNVSLRHAELLEGQASRRRFVRVMDDTGVGAVLVLYPEDQADEIERYVTTADWLQRAGVRVPIVRERGARALLVEDLGDLRLDARGLAQEVRDRRYRQALRIVLQIHEHGRHRPPPNPGWALDPGRLLRELEFFEEHTLRGWLEVDGGHGARGRLYERLAGAVGRLPTVQCHRDYHSRNLMLAGERLAVVDFQDQMSGPVFYDLASLLLDDYRDVEPRLVGELLHAYWLAIRPDISPLPDARLPDAPPGLPAPARQAFCLVGLQRGLKALGTFGFQVTRAGNPRYAHFAPRTWAHVRRNLALLGWSDERELTVPLERAFGQAARSGT